MDLLADINEVGLGSLSWRNPPITWDPLPGGGLRVTVPRRVDYFQDPAGTTRADSAPYLWLPVEGDFVAQACVRPSFAANYDAGALMVRQDATHWAKLCFEATDLGTHAVVSVVTDGISDDANGVDLDVPQVWLQIVRKGDLFAMHYALDGKNWRMVRYFGLALPPVVEVGLVAQCPVGPGTTVDLLALRLFARSVENMRAGV